MDTLNKKVTRKNKIPYRGKSICSQPTQDEFGTCPHRDHISHLQETAAILHKTSAPSDSRSQFSND